MVEITDALFDLVSGCMQPVGRLMLSSVIVFTIINPDFANAFQDHDFSSLCARQISANLPRPWLTSSCL